LTASRLCTSLDHLVSTSPPFVIWSFCGTRPMSRRGRDYFPPHRVCLHAPRGPHCGWEHRNLIITFCGFFLSLLLRHIRCSCPATMIWLSDIVVPTPSPFDRHHKGLRLSFGFCLSQRSLSLAPLSLPPPFVRVFNFSLAFIEIPNDCYGVLDFRSRWFVLWFPVARQIINPDFSVPYGPIFFRTPHFDETGGLFPLPSTP